MGELLALHCQGDWDDDVGKSTADLAPGCVALKTQSEVRRDRSPADGADSTTWGKDGDEVVAVRLAQVENRCHDG
jgi:hypothetical protein